MKKLITLLLIVSFISCNDDEENTNLGQTEADIISYIEENDLDAERTSSGVYYIIEEQGEGKIPSSDAYLKINYEGYFLDGETFDSSDSEAAGFDLLYVIKGFADGIVNFNEGGKGTIIIPPNLAYGDNGASGVIPGGAVLIFDIEIVYVFNAQNEDDIVEYIETNNLETQNTESGLYYSVESLGEGEDITEDSNVTVKYRGYLTDGTEFDASDELGVQFNLQGVIPGFAEGISLYKEGGIGTIIIPPNLGYGDEGVPGGGIPRNAILIFDIEVLSLNN